MDAITFVCHECGKRKNMEEARMLKGGGAVCESCADEGYFACDCCEYYFPHHQERSLCVTCKQHAENLIHV